MKMGFTKKLGRLIAGGAAIVAVSCCSNTNAQTDATWTGAGDGSSWFDADNWDSVTFPNGMFNVRIDNDNGTNTTVNTGASASIFIDSLTVDAGDTLVIENNSDFGIVTDAGRPDSGVINNDGSIQLTNGFNLTDLVIDGEVNLNGSGTFTLGGLSGTASRIVDLSGADGHFINNSNTIEGMGQIGVNTLELTNHGTIDANVSGQSLVLDPNANGMTNDGTLMSSNGGRLALTSGSFDNTGGTIEAGDGSTVALIGSAIVSGGTLDSTGSGAIEVESSQTATIANLSNTGTINQRNNSDFFLDGNIDNQGSINVLNGFNVTDLVIDGNTELSGGGSVTLGGSGTTSRILDQSGGDGVLTNVDNTIQGQGQLGVDSLAIVNQSGGLISANDASGALVVDPSVGDLTNDGTMSATGGGELVLSGSGGGQFLNANGVIEAEDASSVRLASNAAVVGGELITSGSGQILLGASDGAELHDVTLNGNVTTMNNSKLELLGAIENLGSLTVTNGFNNTELRIESDVVLGGGGTVTLGGAGLTSRILDASGAAEGKLTNVDNTIQGKGVIGANRMIMVNQGTIDANEAGATLWIDPRNDGDQFTNMGMLMASNEGVLVLDGNGGGQFLNTNGTISAGVDSTVQLTGGAAVIGGDLISNGTGQFLVAGSAAAELHDVTLNGQLNTLNNSSVELVGIINNNASVISVANGFNNTSLLIESAVSLTGGGTVMLGGSGNTSRILDASGTLDGVLTNVDNLIQGKGQIGVNRTEINNQGTIDANDASGTLELNPRNTGVEFTNSGTIRASSGGELILNGSTGGRFLNTGGTIEALDASTVRLTNLAHIDGGVLQTSGSGKFSVGPSQSVVLKDLSFDGVLEVANNSNVELLGAINNTGEMVVTNGFNNTDIRVEGAVSISGDGVITLGGSSSTTSRILDASGASEGVLTNMGNTIQGYGLVGNGSLRIFNESGGTIDANVAGRELLVDSRVSNTNSGLFRASNQGVLAIAGDLLNMGTVQADADSFVDLTGTLNNSSSGSLIGNGEIDAAFIANNGRIAPGASVGELTLDSDVVFGATSLLDIELGSTGADLLTVMGSLDLSGDLSLSLLSNFLPSSSDTYTILNTSDELFGAFFNVGNGDMLLTADGAGTFVVNYGASSMFGSNLVVLSDFTATAIPEPGSAFIFAGMGICLLTRRRRK